MTKRFPDGTLAVDELSLEVPSGGVLALLGSSGSGKTTTLRMINRLIEPTSGTIAIDGVDVRSLDLQRAAPRHRLRDPAGRAVPAPHGARQRDDGAAPARVGQTAKARERAFEMLDLVGLDRAIAGRYPAQLSGGQQQRVGVARALASDPPVLLMDEPFGAVDPIVRLAAAAGVRTTPVGDREDGRVRHARRRRGDHASATHVAVLRPGGRLAQIGTPAEVLARPVDDFVADFVGTRPRREAARAAAGVVAPDDGR